MLSLSSSSSLLPRLGDPCAQSQRCATTQNPTACSWHVFQTHLTAKHITLNSCYYAKTVLRTSGGMNKMQLSREGTCQCSIPHRTTKKKGGEWLRFFCSHRYETPAEKFYTITKRSNSVLKDIYVTFINMNQSCIEIVEGTIELRVFRFLDYLK